MRIVSLDLSAFGAFMERRVDFARPPRISIIYGSNEAGKSTALRAITGLFYGIDDKRDAHAFRSTTELRVGAVLESKSGALLHVVRRGGRKNTLLDAKGNAIDDAPLLAMLGGVNRGAFETMFGLDHVTLRKGGDALLAGEGEVGASLFQASLGTARVHEVLVSLREQADAIYSTSATAKRPLNETLRAIKEADNETKNFALSADTWKSQIEDIDAKTHDRAEKEEEKRAAHARHARLTRIARTAPLAAAWRILRERRAALGDVVLLDEGAAADRERATGDIDGARAKIAAFEAELAHVIAREAELPAPSALCDADAAMEDLRNRLAAVAVARASIPDVRAEIERIDRNVAKAIATMGAIDRAKIAALTTKSSRVESLRLDAGKLRDAAKRAEIGLRERKDDEARDAVEEETRRNTSRDAIDRALAKLGLAGDADAIANARVPSAETISAFEDEWTTIARENERISRTNEDAESRIEQRRVDLDALAGEGNVPTEGDLAELRAKRDAAFATARTSKSAAAFDELERATRTADALADRLRREADRVHERARLEAERQGATRERDRAIDAQASLRARENDLAQRWRDAWAAAKVTPSSPREMRVWLSDHASVARLIDAERDARTRAASRVNDLRAKVTSADRALADAHAALDTWERAWEEALSPLGLSKNTTLDDARARITEMAELARTFDLHADLTSRLSRQSAEVTAFGDAVRATARLFAVDLEQRDPEAAASELLRRFADARQTRESRGRLVDRRAATEAQLAETRAVEASATARMDVLFRAAGVRDVDALVTAERASTEARSLDAQIDRNEAQLIEAGGGASVASTLAEAESETGSPDELAARAEETETRIDELEREIAALHQWIGSSAAGLRGFETATKAADAATRREEELAKARDLSDDWARARAASVILARRIEKLRAAQEHPIVARASTLLAELTGGSLTALRVGYADDDHALLVCVREGGREVTVDALSDGTRDALYLALRIANLERLALASDPPPFILDDALVHFDDERATSALRALGALAASMQVIFFTHHARLVELARAALPESVVGVIDLSPPPAPPRAHEPSELS